MSLSSQPKYFSNVASSGLKQSGLQALRGVPRSLILTWLLDMFAGRVFAFHLCANVAAIDVERSKSGRINTIIASEEVRKDKYVWSQGEMLRHQRQHDLPSADGQSVRSEVNSGIAPP